MAAARTIRPTDDPRLHVALLTLVCFLLGSTGWLLWLYHLMGLVAPEQVDLLTMGVGYFMQAVGTAAFALHERMRSEAHMRRTVTLAVGAYLACLVPAGLTPSLAPVLAFGYLANLLCGYLQGYYLYCLACHVGVEQRGVVFGAAYAVSTLASWLLSLAPGGVLTRGVGALAVCAALTAAAVWLARASDGQPQVDETPLGSEDGSGRGLLALACATVALMSLTKGAGYGFPTVDLADGVSLELSRLLYGVGLLAAGVASDRDRRYGALCCAAALVAPFLTLALSGAAAPATIMWALGYLFFGFFSVYRVLLLADLAASLSLPVAAGLGLLFGRVGDALGAVTSSLLAGAPLALITVVSVLFACTLGVFFFLYQRLYAPAAEPVPSERERFETFAARHDLSAREREVLRLVLAEHTNAEIAAKLFVSEATVKFHVRNLLKKTGCKTRLEVMAAYGAQGGGVTAGR